MHLDYTTRSCYQCEWVISIGYLGLIDSLVDSLNSYYWGCWTIIDLFGHIESQSPVDACSGWYTGWDEPGLSSVSSVGRVSWGKWIEKCLRYRDWRLDYRADLVFRWVRWLCLHHSFALKVNDGGCFQLSNSGDYYLIWCWQKETAKKPMTWTWQLPHVATCSPSHHPNHYSLVHSPNLAQHYNSENYEHQE